MDPITALAMIAIWLMAVKAVTDSSKKEEKERVAEDEIEVYRMNGYIVTKGAEIEKDRDC